jgi:hypothetical protein
MAAAWLEVESQTCGDCGTRKDEWGWWDADGKFHLFAKAPYVVKVSRDPGCAAIERVRERDVKKADGKQPPPSVRYYLSAG